jgi:3-keto-L-gulonate-6-phosphate decarboxylase
VCDFKVCDGGGLFARLAGEAGANYMDVMAAAHDATLRCAIREADKHKVSVIADIMFCADPIAAAVRAQSIGVAMIGWHLGYDHRAENRGLRAIDGLDEVLKAVRIPVQVVGGLSVEHAIEAARKGASSVVIGGPLVPADRGPALASTLREIVQGVRAASSRYRQDYPSFSRNGLWLNSRTRIPDFSLAPFGLFDERRTRGIDARRSGNL